MSNLIEIIIRATDENVESIAGGVSDALGGIAEIATGALTFGLAGVTAGFGALSSELFMATGEAMASQDAMAKLDAVLKATGNAIGITNTQFSEWASELQSVTRFSDETVVAAETLLLKFGNIGKDIFPAVLTSSADLAAMMGTDLTSAAQLLGKVMQSPSESVGLLERQIGKLSEEEKKQIELMTRAGDVAGAQTFLLDLLQGRVGGVAQAMGETFSGQIEILKNQFSDLQEEIGFAVLPILQQLMDDVIKPAIPFVSEIARAFAAMISALGEGDIGGAADALMEFDAVRAIFAELGVSADQFRSIAAGVESVVSRLVDVGLSLADAFGSFASGDIDSGIITALTALNVPPEIIEQVLVLTDSIAGLFSALSEDAPQFQALGEQVSTSLAQAFASVSPEVIANLAGTINTLTDIWKVHGDTIMTALSTAWSTIVVIVSGAVLLLSSLIFGIVNSISGILDAASLAWQGRWKEAWDAIVLSFSESMLNILGSFSIFESVIQNNLGGFIASWTEVFRLAGIIVSTTWNNLVTLTSAKMMEMTSGIQASIINTINWLKGIVPQFISIGQSWFEGMTQGILMKVSQLQNAVIQSITSTIQKAREALGIASPSEVFSEMGEQISAGTAQGIQRGSSSAVQAASQMAGGITSAGAGALASTPSGAAPVIINLSVVLDGQQVGSLVYDGVIQEAGTRGLTLVPTM